MISPLLLQDTPFRNQDAWLDFLGVHAMIHRIMATAVKALTGNVYRTAPLGDGGRSEWLLAHQAEHVAMNRALGIAGPVDLASYDLADAEQFASWNFLHAGEHRRAQLAAGVV